jgi:hypothetical protein
MFPGGRKRRLVAGMEGPTYRFLIPPEKRRTMAETGLNA